MRFRYILGLAAVCATAAACENDPIGPSCVERTSTIASTKGDTVTTTSGLRYINGATGSGTAATSCSTVGIHYTLFVNGVVVDSLRTEGAAYPVTPGENPPTTIEGVAEGVLGLQVGSTRRLIIPPSLGYGSEALVDRTGRVLIPANSTLIFDLTVRVVR